MMKRRVFNRVATMALAAVLPMGALAQDKPPLKLLVGFAPGGSVDVVARLLAERLRLPLGQQVVVENKPGAGGRLVLGEVKRAPADGNTLVISPSGALVISPWLYNLNYDPVKDFTPIARVVTFDFAVTAGPVAPSGDIRAVLNWLKANPARANYGTSGAGTVPHFAGVLLSQASGVPLTHVAYKGGAPAVSDLLGGQIPIMVDTISETIEHHRAGRLRILAVTGNARSPALPDVPTLKESGIDATAEAFVGLFAPAGLPADKVKRLSDAIAEVLKAPDLQARVREIGPNANYAGPQQLGETQVAELRRWERPIKASGYKAE
ncbi:Bug family tripartite tricarboxylate transporter substrate binding protein [Cupriavidus sp. KK10]|jgi:tripartite-type tricarboxylate transporter receptor subunit TctC|uniref:Bug family tripartite tricarboxylate transporter substrate binding protein n=1 Tax=Cupriavidus sp. KK10 TaxID=1478019 RepID=UPI001BABA64B|nr:Bug family tripartite tricarboxylate transporter substrate binding protein [Cupriavidus sp. KK10]QUN26335.1 Bug family tripartite tricarboxylate transporter substrate binding protein [Cupriavidus sp. KK10]